MVLKCEQDEVRLPLMEDTNMANPNLDRIKKLYADPFLMIYIANQVEESYAQASGHPEDHTFFDERDPEKVANNLAGVVATISGVQLLAFQRGAKTAELLDSMLVSLL